MFERFCALLLRIYPAGFRRAYGREAVQLVRDRARHERGVFLRARLLLDLAIDLFATWRHGWQPGTAITARIDGAPRFDIIEVHGPRPEALAAGMLTSMLMFARRESALLISRTFSMRPMPSVRNGRLSGENATYGGLLCQNGFG